MKVHEILPETLEERALGRALATGIVGAAMAMAPGRVDPSTPAQPVQTSTRQISQHDQGPPEPSREELQQRQITTEIADRIAKRYSVEVELASRIVELAHRHEDPVFPTAKDILAVVGIESSFNPDAVSRLRRDPALGLMQVRPGKWDLEPSDLEDIEDQIKHGALILKQYYRRLGDRDAAVQAYNIGLHNFRQGQTNPRYLTKYQRELNWLASI